LLLQIKNNNKNIKRTLTAVPSGKEFEQSLLTKLSSGGSYNTYMPANFNRLLNFKRAKEIIQNKASGNKIIKLNLFNDLIESTGPIYIYQPFGSQQYPDILLIRKDYIIPFETKFSNKKGNKPT
jgi:hypothetical protein